MKKTETIQVRVTEEEKMFFRLRAKQLGMNVSDMIKEAVFGQKGVNNGREPENISV